MAALTLRLRILVAALAGQRLRAVVAVAMVSLGVASTLVAAALGTGARLEMQALQDRMGRNLFFVRAGERPVPAGRGSGWYVSSRLEPGEARLIEQRVKAVGRAVPVHEQPALVKLGSKRVVTTVRGVTPEFLELRNFEVERGRSLTQADGRARNRVALVGPFVARRLAGGESVVGLTLRVAGVPFRVVGVLHPKGAGSDGSDQDDQVLVPFETAVRRLENVESASMLLIQARDESRMEEAIRDVRALLRTMHYIEPGAREDFDILETVRQNVGRRMSNRFVQGLARILAAVTLLLGGAGVFAVTYLNVRERVGEIGLRMAIGATRASIAALVVTEACALSLLGGLAGTVVGAVVTGALEVATTWPMAIDLRGIGAPFAISAAIGMLCSVAPAWRASRVMPAVALAG